MKRNTKNKGFTLLELMVAISIFAGLIILVVGSFASSVSYQRRVKVNREVSQSARNVLDSISREVELSQNKPVMNLTYNSEPVYNFSVLDGSVPDDKGSTLVVRDENDRCRRYYLVEDNNIQRLAVQVKEDCSGFWTEKPNFLTNNNVDISSLKFISLPNTKSAQSASSLDIELILENSQSFFGDELNVFMSPKTTVTIRNDGQEQL